MGALGTGPAGSPQAVRRPRQRPSDWQGLPTAGTWDTGVSHVPWETEWDLQDCTPCLRAAHNSKHELFLWRFPSDASGPQLTTRERNRGPRPPAPGEGPTWQHPGQSEEGGVVGHEAGGEQERRVLPVQVGQLPLQVHVELAGPGDVPGAAGPSAVLLQGVPERKAQGGKPRARPV